MWITDFNWIVLFNCFIADWLYLLEERFTNYEDWQKKCHKIYLLLSVLEIRLMWPFHVRDQLCRPIYVLLLFFHLLFFVRLFRHHEKGQQNVKWQVKHAFCRFASFLFVSSSSVKLNIIYDRSFLFRLRLQLKG